MFLYILYYTMALYIVYMLCYVRQNDTVAKEKKKYWAFIQYKMHMYNEKQDLHKYATVCLKSVFSVCKWTFRSSDVVAWRKHPKGILSEELFSHFKVCFDPGGSHFTDTLGFRSVCQLPCRLERGLMGKRCEPLVNLTQKKKDLVFMLSQGVYGPPMIPDTGVLLDTTQ